jgi:hypothetical protein
VPHDLAVALLDFEERDRQPGEKNEEHEQFHPVKSDFYPSIMHQRDLPWRWISVGFPRTHARWCCLHATAKKEPKSTRALD